MSALQPKSIRRRVFNSISCWVIAAPLALTSCADHYRGDTKPIDPDDLVPRIEKEATLPSIEVINFEIGEIDANYSSSSKNTFRQHNAIQLPNLIQEDLEDRGLFRSVYRSHKDGNRNVEYFVGGKYDFFLSLEVAAFVWTKNVAESKETMTVRVKDSRNGQEIFRDTFIDENKDEAPKHVAAHVTYQQPAFIARIGTEIAEAIEADWQSRQ